MTTPTIWVPLSTIRLVADAIENVTAEETALSWARAEAAIKALTPFISHVCDNPHMLLTEGSPEEAED